MADCSLYGELDSVLDGEALARVLGRAGVEVVAGAFAVRLWTPEGAVKLERRAEDGWLLTDVLANNPGDLSAVAHALSALFTAVHVRHRLEVYDEGGAVTTYAHCGWPRVDDARNNV